MATVDGKPPRKADQLLQALSKKYEDKARDRDARSSGRNTPTRRTPRGSIESNTPTRRTPRGSRERSGAGDTASENLDNSTSSLFNRSARGTSPSIRSELFSPAHRRSPSVDGLQRPSRLTESRSPAVRASPGLFDKTRSPARRVSPVQSPGLIDQARTSPCPSPMRRQSPSPSPLNRRDYSLSPTKDNFENGTDSESSPRKSDRSRLFARTSTPTRDSSNIRDELSARPGLDSSIGHKQPESEVTKEPDPPNKAMDESSDTINVADTHQTDTSPENSSKDTNMKLALDFISDNSTHSARSGKVFGASHKPRSPERSTRGYKPEFSPNKSLDKSLDLTSTTLQDGERPESRRSSMSNYSFSQPIACGSPRSSLATSPQPPRYAIEKEQTDSQLRKLEVENSSLKLENKSLKDKYNRAQSQIVHLETKLKTMDNEIHKLRSERKKELSLTRQKNAEVEESLQESAREEKDESRRKVELLKVENESLEKELQAARRMTDTAIQSSDISKIMSGYKQESSSLRAEIKKLKLVLKESEASLESEMESRRRITETNRKLTEMNNILKQQLEMDSGGSVADKQVKGIESRLRITEDRLYQERADRAGKLSEVEDKLLNENAKLQVDVKEVSRQLNREREKLRVTEMKLQELKDQQLSLSFLTQGSAGGRRFTSTHRGGAGDGKKFSPEVTKIVDEIQKETGAHLNQEDDVISYLHKKERAVMKQLNDWKNELQQLRDLHRQMGGEGDTRRIVEELQDTQHRMAEVENVLNSEISKLVKEKHDGIAAVKSSEDKIEALEAELQYLRVQVKVGGGSYPSDDTSYPDHKSEKVTSLESQIHSIQLKLSQMERSLKLSESEVSSLQEQLDAKTTSLDEAIKEIENMRRDRNSDESESDKRQRRIDELNIEMRGLQSDLAAMKEKNSLISQTKAELESRVDELTNEMDNVNSNLMNSSRNAETFNTQKSHLEQEISEKCEEIRVLRDRYESLEGKHTETREDLINNRDHVTTLTKQVASLEQQLQSKVSEYDSVTNRLQSQEDTYTTTEEKLLQSQKQVDGLKTELSLEKLNHTKLKSESEREAANHKHEAQKLSREITTLNTSLDSLRTQKSEFSKDVEVSKVRLAELQARLSEAQSEITSHKEKEKMLSEERDRLTEEKHEAKLSAARLEAEHKQEVQELSRATQELRHQSQELKSNLESQQTNMGFEKDRLSSDLELVKKQLSKREMEIERLTDTVAANKQEIESKSHRIKELESQLEDATFKNKEQVEELNSSVRQRDQQIESYEKSLQHLDSESRSKKELEVYVRQIETELEDKRTSEQRLKNELTTVSDKRNRDQTTIDSLKQEATKSDNKQHNEVSRLKLAVDKAHEETKSQRLQHDKEKTTLQDKFNQVNSDLKAAEATISVMSESKQTQMSSLSSLERKNDSLKSQLQESQVNERLSDQKLSGMREQLEDYRQRMVKAEEKVADLSSSIVKVESEAKIEKEKNHYLKSEKEDLESTKVSSEYKVEMLQRELDTLQTENSAIREQLDSQKEMVESRSKKQTQHLKSQLDTHEKERSRLQSANQDLSAQIERLRDQLSSQKEEGQKFKHKCITVEQKLIETETRLNKSEESQISHDNIQDKLHKRNLDLELELSELKNLLSRMEGNSAALDLESSKIDNLTRAELNRTMTEWSSRLQSLLENERGKHRGDNSQLTPEQIKIRVMELEGKLKHEQLMHTVTKNQLKSLEEENIKLRKRLLLSGSNKRRAPSGKSREELIREKILESEMRVAAQMGVTNQGTMNAGLTGLLTNTGTFLPASSSRYHPLNISPSKYSKATDAFGGMSLLGSLGFTSPRHDQRLNNTLSPNNSFGEEDSRQS